MRKSSKAMEAIFGIQREQQQEALQTFFREKTKQNVFLKNIFLSNFHFSNFLEKSLGRVNIVPKCSNGSTEE